MGGKAGSLILASMLFLSLVWWVSTDSKDSFLIK